MVLDSTFHLTFPQGEPLLHIKHWLTFGVRLMTMMR